MFQSIIAIFETNEEAQKAKHALIAHGFDLSRIDVNYNVDVEADRSTDGQQTATTEVSDDEENSGSVVTVRTENMRESLDATTILEDCGALDVNEFSARPSTDPESLFDPENLS